MPPSKPKGPSRPRGRAPAGERRKRRDLELPFEDVEPLRADDPARQHVPQFPTTSRRAVQVLRDAEVGGAPDGDDEEESTSALPKKAQTPFDAPLPARFAGDELEGLAEPGFTAAGLYVERGPGVGQLAPVRQGTLLIGRASSADLRLQHPSISRRHSLLTRRGERFFLKDLGSQNGSYVNQVRIDREVELFPGDELILGTSQLRLRGPNGVDETVTPRPRADPRRDGGPSLLAVAIASCAVGIALATAILFVAFKWLQGTEPDPVASTPVQVTQAAPVQASGAPVAREEVAHPPPSPETASEATGSGDARAVTPPAEAPGAAPAQVRRASTRPEPKPDPAVIARYELGEVDAAIALATRKGLDALASRMSRFRTEFAAGQRALAQRDDVTAVRRLETARTLDEEIAGGWGKVHGELRQQLSRAHVLAAGRQSRAGNVGAARRSLTTALRLDPQNGTAKAELERLARTRAIDAAFGE